jgi:hypothetical protein
MADEQRAVELDAGFSAHFVKGEESDVDAKQSESDILHVGIFIGHDAWPVRMLFNVLQRHGKGR